jgi:electron transfer flavoprotein alpha subunit/electron transfer flavoprotein alpha/beta subunit
MDLILLCKYVPDIDRIPADAWDRERGTLIRSRLEMAFNPLDRVALGMALAVRERRPGTRIVAVTMGPPAAEAMLREAVAYGADAAVLATDRAFAGADTIATAYTLARVIRSMAVRGAIDADFAVLAGMQSPDGDTAQVPAQVASFLDAPLYPYVCGLEAGDGDALRLTCLNSVGFQHVTTGRRPFVATATRLYPDLPFHVGLSDMQRANETEIAVWGRGDVELDDARIGLGGSRTRVVRIFEPPRRGGAQEPLVAEAEDFAERAARMMAELAAEFGSAHGPIRSADDSMPTLTAGDAYYAGPCVALCETTERGLATVSLEITSACARMARQLGVEPAAVVVGRPDDAAVDALRRHGARHAWFVLGLDDEVFRVRERAHVLAALLRNLAPQIVVTPATLTGRVLAPYVSARLDCGLTADCSALAVRDFTRRDETFRRILFQTRPALGGNIMATIVSIYDDPAGGRPQMATVRPGALPAVEMPAASCETHVFRAPTPPPGVGDAITVERRPEGEKEIELEDYEVIVCVGMGVGDRATIEAAVEPFRAAVERWLGVPVGLGCSRAMVDAGVLPHAHQIGQTGIVVKPKIYFGLGVSGAIQHKIGMEGSRIIVSVNRDPVAPIHGFADHAIVGDVREVLPALVDAMGRAASTGTD